MELEIVMERKKGNTLTGKGLLVSAKTMWPQVAGLLCISK